jgi:hypothetical protein
MEKILDYKLNSLYKVVSLELPGLLPDDWLEAYMHLVYLRLQKEVVEGGNKAISESRRNIIYDL